jgi:hypothetical protein
MDRSDARTAVRLLRSATDLEIHDGVVRSK